MSQQGYEVCELLAALLLFLAAFSEAMGVTGGQHSSLEAVGNVLSFLPQLQPWQASNLPLCQEMQEPDLLCSRTSCGKMYPSAEGNFPAAMHSWGLGGQVVSGAGDSSGTVSPWWNLHGAAELLQSRMLLGQLGGTWRCRSGDVSDGYEETCAIHQC